MRASTLLTEVPIEGKFCELPLYGVLGSSGADVTDLLTNRAKHGCRDAGALAV